MKTLPGFRNLPWNIPSPKRSFPPCSLRVVQRPCSKSQTGKSSFISGLLHGSFAETLFPALLPARGPETMLEVADREKLFHLGRAFSESRSEFTLAPRAASDRLKRRPFFPWKKGSISYTIRKMAKFNRDRSGRYTLVYRGGPVNMRELIAGIRSPGRRFPGGRGAPGIFELGGRAVVCRQYLHGGWLRGITGGTFFGEDRALRELEVTAYLEERGFSVVSPVGYVVESQASSRKLYFLSLLLPDARDLMTRFASAGRMERLRMSKTLAAALFRMGRLGVYHPDLHLRNVLVAPGGELFFLDFDRACRKEVTSGDYERMFWRLDRFVRKYAILFGRPVDDRERLIFLRAYERLSGDRIIERMAQKRDKMERTSKLGWTIDRFLYRKRRS